MLNSLTEYEACTWPFATDYIGTSKGRIYNKRTQRFAKKTVCGGSIGYWMDKAFRTTNEINQKKQPIERKPFLATKEAEGLPF